nr:zinc finger, CCHC-type [Tanacetum cinerariifolium]
MKIIKMPADDLGDTSTLKPVTPIVHYQCPKLKSINYTVWAIQIKVILEAHGLLEAIEPKENTQVDEKKDKATTAFLYQALTEDAKELGKTLDESLLVRKLLDSTPNRFIQIVASIEQTNLNDITLDEIVGKLKAFEERIKHRKEGQVESQKNLLFAHGEHSRKGRRFSKRGGKSNRNKREWDVRKVRCYKCGKLGHYKKNYKGTSTTQEQSNLILEVDEPSLLMTTHETKHKEVLLNEGQIQPGKYATADASIWYLDNGASNHMTGIKSYFRYIDESITGRDWDNNGKETSTQDTFWASFVVEGVDNENPTPVNTKNNDNKYQEHETITDPDSPITPLAYRNSKNRFDDTPVRGLKWVFKTKRDAKGKIIKYKARLVAKGYLQEQGIDFDEVFTPVARIETVHLILVLAAYHGWQNVKLDQTLKSLDFKKCNLEQAVYIKRSKTSKLIVGVYVDDLIITGTPRKEIDLFKSQMEDKFKMSDLGLLAYCLRVEVTQTGGVITIRQTGYINKILRETSILESNDTKIPVDSSTKLVKAEDGNSVDATYYRSLIGSLRYLLHTRPYLSYSVGLLSRFMQDPKDHHLKAVKQVIRYIKGTKEHGIIYKKEGSCKITSYSDSSYEINTDQGKGTTGIVFYFGESPITWCTQKQPIVVLSSCESEFMAATGAACQALWLKRLLSELTS